MCRSSIGAVARIFVMSIPALFLLCLATAIDFLTAPISDKIHFDPAAKIVEFAWKLLGIEERLY